MDAAGSRSISAAPEAALTLGRSAAIGFVCGLFVLSGACGLAYEVVWAKYLGLFLGNTVLVHAAVLGAFMGGLAAGSLLVGRRAERSTRPLKVYGWLELAIAAYALAFPALAAAGQSAVAAAAGTFPPGTPGLTAVRLALGVALLIVPTVLMGGTYPFLTAHLERSARLGAAGANWLYCANCAGAVLGAVTTGFALIPGMGLNATVTAIAILNAIVGLSALAAAVGETAERAEQQPAPPPSPALTRDQRRVLVAICLSGATAFFYQLVWTRLFAVSLGSSTYSFTLMLAAFISGLALGSALTGLLPAVRRAPLLWLAGAEILIAMAIALSIPLYPRLPFLAWQWRWLLRPVEESIPLFHTFQYGLTFLVMAVPTLLFGLTFPAAIRAAGNPAHDPHVASHAALVYGWNTIGTLAGVALAGGLLIPFLGLRGTLLAGAAVNLAIGACLLVPGGLQRTAARALLAAAAAVAVALPFAPGWNRVSLSSGTFRINTAPPARYADFEKALSVREVVFYKEDFGTTVAVIRSKEKITQQIQLGLIVDGKTDATSLGDMPTQVMVAHLPLFYRPRAKDVFVLGLGSGVTVSSALTHPIESLDCVEISRAVVGAVKAFSATNRDSLRDPRVRLTLDDGRTYLASTRKKYDVIISEPTNPWISGVGNLFSEEAFATMKASLKPGGLVAQWFHSYSLDDRLVATIVRTFRRTFPHMAIFAGNMSDWIILGSLEPIRPDFGAMEERFLLPEANRDLARVKITRLAGLLGRQTHTEEGAKKLEDGGGINSDDLPLLEYLAPQALYMDKQARRVEETDQRFVRNSGLHIEAYFARKSPQRDDYATMLNCAEDRRMYNPHLRRRLLFDCMRRWPRDGVYPRLLAIEYEGMERWQEALRLAELAARLGVTDAKLRARLRARVRAEELGLFETGTRRDEAPRAPARPAAATPAPGAGTA